MPEPRSNLRPVSEIWSLEKPAGRFNNWGERKWIAASAEKLRVVEEELRILNVSPRAKDLCKAAKLSDSSGVEFVVFSDAQLPGPMGFDWDGSLVPCFLPFDGTNPQFERRQADMAERGVFVYDGWVPVTEWTAERLESIVSLLDDVLSLFSVVGKYYARWEPKYVFSKPPTSWQLFDEKDLPALSRCSDIVDRLPIKDRLALSRSTAWISNALRTAPIQRFLLLFVSIESLATYIESREKPSTSQLQQGFSSPQPSGSEKQKAREECIHKIQSQAKNLADAVGEAGSECIQGKLKKAVEGHLTDIRTAINEYFGDMSIRKKLESHLTGVFGSTKVASLMFDEKAGEKSLWRLRHDIAHGNLSMLDDAETLFIERQVGLLEDIARGYLRRIFAQLVQQNYFPGVRRPVGTLPVRQGVGGEGIEYMGPTDMVEHYLFVEGLR